MFVRWLHKIWRFLLITLLGLFLAVILSALLMFVALQAPQSQEWVKDQVTALFDEEFEGTLTIREISGRLPYHVDLTGVDVHAPGVDDPVLSIDEVTLRVQLWNLLQGRLLVRQLDLQSPVLDIRRDRDGQWLLAGALQQRSGTPDPDPEIREETRQEERQVLRLEIVAPTLRVHDGNLRDRPAEDSELRWNAESIDGEIFLEITDQQRFLDIQGLSGHFLDERLGPFEIHGQLFSDREYLEINGGRFRLSDSQWQLNAEATPVDLFASDLPDQLHNATYRVELYDSWLQGSQIAELLPRWPFPDYALDLELNLEGTPERLHLDRFLARVGESSLHLSGELTRLTEPEFAWRTSIQNLVLQPDEIETLLEPLGGVERDQAEYLSESTLDGEWSGDLQTFRSRLQFLTENGSAELDGEMELGGDESFRLTASLDSLDLTPIFPQRVERSLLDGELALEGQGYTLDRTAGTLSARLNEGHFNRIDYTYVDLNGEWQERRFSHNLELDGVDSSVRSSGWVRNLDEQWELSLNGHLDRLNLTALWPDIGLPIESLTMEYNTDLEWTSLDDLTGRLRFFIDNSVVDSRSLPSHQLFADIDATGTNSNRREFRLTSTFLDVDLEGDVYPTRLRNLFAHWSRYFNQRLIDEVTFAESIGQTEAEPGPDFEDTELSLRMEVKDVDLLRAYLPRLAGLESRSRIELDLEAGTEQMLLTGSFSDPGFRAGDFEADRLDASLTANFRYGDQLREYANLDLRLNADQYRWRNLSFDDGFLNASMRGDSLMVRHTAMEEDHSRFDMTLLNRLAEDRIEMELREFILGTPGFEWVAQGVTRMQYNRDKSFEIRDLLLTSDEQQIEMDGIYSPDPDHRMDYTVRDLELERISDLIGGRVTFGGRLNGEFTTRTLTRIPVIEGTIDVRRGRLDGRTVGDLTFESEYSSTEERFDTDIHVYTDPERYPGYYARNDSIGQDIHLHGYFTVPDPAEPDREFFYFDADLREIDTWIATSIVPQILLETEGRSSGQGFISGSLDNINFSAEFDIEDVVAVPYFLNTEYTLNGRLIFDRYRGVIFDDMRLRDADGGEGTLYGAVELDYFSPDNYLDLTLSMENLQFMNNPYDPDIPFYASARGTGEARITGSTLSPYLRTTQPVEITSGSRIAVPVLADTELQQSHSFIRFVETFDRTLLRELEDQRREEREENGNGDPADLTFAERFTLDLQFTAPDPVQFQLVFDRVTNESLRSRGTGQLRLTLEDQNFNLFGRMNISSGTYQFVAGDIISRRFSLTQGGSIIWEGDPANVRVDIDATYRARPDLSSLLTSESPGRMQGAQRVPIDLVLNIGGTLSELENDFYFQIPSAIEGTLDPTMVTQINALNNNEEEKIIQATSLLLSGNFIPMGSASTEGGTAMALRESLTGGAVVNPLITGQVINPLLSDQINQLLRSDMAVDIDFNLTPYNQVDLGVALRFYDDRLVLRRDGQITGPYSDIGDLGATYRINRTFALTAFHRQDPTLSASSSTEPRQVQEMNGVGVEAQMQFNSWQEFRHRIGRAIGRLFGRDENAREEEEETEDTDTNGENDDGEDILASDSNTP